MGGFVALMKCFLIDPATSKGREGPLPDGWCVSGHSHLGDSNCTSPVVQAQHHDASGVSEMVSAVS